MKTMNKAFIGALTLLSSNFAFANDGLDGSISVGFILFGISLWKRLSGLFCFWFSLFSFINNLQNNQ